MVIQVDYILHVRTVSHHRNPRGVEAAKLVDEVADKSKLDLEVWASHWTRGVQNNDNIG